MAEVKQQYYILLQDKAAKKREKALSSFRSDKKFVSLLKGELLTEVCEKYQPKEQTMIKLQGVERPSLTLECSTTDVQNIDKEDVELLLPLVSLSERLRVFHERKRLRTGKKMDVDSNVWVDVQINSIKKEFPGVIKYKGPLIPGRPGIHFGVELMVDGVGKGTSDGSFKDKTFFHCTKDSGIFVSLEKLQPRTKDIKNIIKDRKRSTESYSMVVEGTKKDLKNKSIETSKSLTSAIQLNDKIDCKEIKHKTGDVVWVFICEKPHRGRLRYIGRLPGEKEIFAGIEMDTNCGKGYGEYNGTYLFTCEKDHGHFSPIRNVISNKQYGQMHVNGSSNGIDLSSFLKEKFFNLFSSLKNDALKGQEPSSIQTSCEDIVQMESKFSKVSGNTVIKEQEELFRKVRADAQTEKLKGDKVNDMKPKYKQVFGSDKELMGPTKHENESTNKNHSSWDMVTDVPKENHLDTSSRNESNSKTMLAYSQESTRQMSSAIADRQQAISRSLSNGSRSSNSPISENNHYLGTQSGTQARGVSRLATESTSQRFKNQASLASVNSNLTDLEIGSMVEVLSKNAAPKFGLIRWIGFTAAINDKVAGLELEEEMDACSDGTFQGERYFNCPNRRGFFVHLHNCKPDSRFPKGRNLLVSREKRLSGTDFGRFDSPIINDEFISPPESLEIYLRKPNQDDSQKHPRGIQGHHNSCYLDATLFAAFSFSSSIDSILLRPKGEKDLKQYEEVQSVLRDSIVYPLRSHGFVRADRVFDLRRLLDQLGTVTGLIGEEKDPEEFLRTLLHQVLKAEPFLKIKSGKEVHKEYFYQVLADKDSERVLPSVEELLKRSFHESSLKLTEVPPCLILQMPRFGKGFKMYKRILPSLTINIGELVYNAPQDCSVCGSLAMFYCNVCVKITGIQETDCSGNFCKECNSRYHSHARRANHHPKPLHVSREICTHYAGKHVEHQEMELFAIVCIETSHYVTFAKCQDKTDGTRWCFFDSMADRVGSKDGYNIPCVTECNEVVEWLSSEKENRHRIIETDDKDMPEKVRRILGDAYMCLYQSREMCMYK